MRALKKVFYSSLLWKEGLSHISGSILLVIALPWRKWVKDAIIPRLRSGPFNVTQRNDEVCFDLHWNCRCQNLLQYIRSVHVLLHSTYTYNTVQFSQGYYSVLYSYVQCMSCLQYGIVLRVQTYRKKGLRGTYPLQLVNGSDMAEENLF